MLGATGRGADVLEPERGMEAKDEFEIVREIIRHEDGLINNRTSWFLIMQGVLFSSAAGVTKLLIDHKPSDPPLPISIRELWAVLVVIGLFGAYTAVTLIAVTNQAYAQMEAATAWWRSRGNAKAFPPVRGEWHWSWGWLFSMSAMPIFVALVWLGFFVMVTVHLWPQTP